MPPFVVIWIWLCAYLNCAGWTLSALHQLNAAGYAVTLTLGIGAGLIWQKKSGASLVPKIRPAKLGWRFRRSFPLAFLLLATLALLGGALHAPVNYDGLAYRTPRVLHWLAENQWHWIHSDFPRLNTRTAGFEWLTAPIISLTGSDRLIFLLNIIAFLLLPGRVFAVLTRLGVRPCAAWHWMWLLPAGYGFVLQAGSIVNDMFGAFMTLAAFEFALRASREKKLSDLWTAGLAVALMTAVKAFNILLLLPWLIAALPALRLLLRKPVASGCVIIFALGASMIPTSVLNIKYCGDWTGQSIEQATMGGGHLWTHLWVNVANLSLNNLVPPVFPMERQWEHFVAGIMPPSVRESLTGKFEDGLIQFKLPELQMEESAGIGCGLTLMILGLLTKKIRAGGFFIQDLRHRETWIILGVWLGLGIVLVRLGLYGSARYLLPFYFLLIVPALSGGAVAEIFRHRLWRLAGLATFATALLLLVASPPRPLWPATTCLKKLGADQSPHPLVRRAWTVYSVYGQRADSFGPVLKVLPADSGPLGLMAFDVPETSLWQPFGSRRVRHICHGDPPEAIRARGIEYVLIEEKILKEKSGVNFAGWLAANHAEAVKTFTLPLRAGQEPGNWLLARLR